MATWPTTLPQCGLHEGWTLQTDPIVLTSDMDMGPPKRRKTNTTSYDKYGMAMVLTPAQWTILRTFYKANAAIAFTWVDPVSRASASVMFNSEPQVTGRSGKLYHVSFSIEVQP